MPLRFHKSLKIFPGVKINLSKSGISTSIGKRGATVNFNKHGTRATIGIPGTGLSYSSQTNVPKTAPRVPPPIQSNASNANDGCLNGILNLVVFPFRVLVDLFKGIFNSQTRRSSLILVGVITFTCLGFLGLSSVLGANSPLSTFNGIPTKTQIVQISIAQTSYAAEKLTKAAPSPTNTIVNTPTVSPVSLADYPRVAASRFQTLQDSFAEFVEIHKQFVADSTVNQNADWHSHAISILGIVATGTNELASMQNIPVEYAAFHQSMQPLASEVHALESNYLAALNNQDMNALNQANTNLVNSITYFNQASTLLQASNITPTPKPSQTSSPTATIIYIPPVQPTSAHPAGTSGQCVDGTYTYAQHKQGACSHHGGVAIWWGP